MSKKPFDSFLQHGRYYEAYTIASNDPTTKNRSRVNQLFYHYQIEARFVTYMNTTMWRCAKDYRKKRQRWHDSHRLTLNQPVGEDLTVLDVMTVEDTNFSGWGEEGDSFELVTCPRLQTVISRLTLQQRLILYDHVANQLSFKEIAEKLGVSQQSTSKSFHRIIRKFRKAYQEGEWI
ncbi:sigma-70 family RNA polymerase sigma factor [Halobacillus ihumii]|uniref:sigma-70 family RNA polymerase sigma factor n=1 Tax=Halobacillus ihumii TaxID=2686092 RepID=UPI0013D7F2B5|nr:sigma-70 family RNA polymerase sigma factor [Halobacillus ihumii]